MREPIITRRCRIVGSNSAAYSDVRELDVMARLHRARRECFALDGVSPALRAEASDFSLRGQRKVTKRKATPAKPPACGGFPHLTLWVGRYAADGTSLYQLRLRLTADMPPLPLGEGRGEGNICFPVNQTASLKQQLITNWLNQLKFLSTSCFHVSNRAIKIARRQSISRKSTMTVIVTTSQVTGSRMGAGTQGR